MSLGKVPAERAVCPNCPDSRREVVTFYKIRGNETFLDRTLAQIGVPAFDIIIARCRDRAVGLELAGDAQAVLKSLRSADIASDQEGLSWE
ncbi:MAG TPA: hypothetical protein VFW23_18770, partial [Tepidisphaeraceae bacterium]|nr:hypothetical protein [Tepidisphaeraceae bacterium]